jgi:RluA family pseudouridine synthase
MTLPSPTVPLVLYEDADLLAVDKPEGLSAIPERDLTLPSAQRLLEAARGERLFVVHRIDKEVSGLLLFARHAAAHRDLSIAFEKKEVEKRYLAIAWGALDPKLGGRGEVSLPIHEFGSGRMGVDARGKPSITRWERVHDSHKTSRSEAADAASGPPVTTLLRLSPVTGRRHQLRVHLYALGHALVGDPRYGEHGRNADVPRLALHAHEARVKVGGRVLELRAPLGPSFVALLERFGHRSMGIEIARGQGSMGVEGVAPVAKAEGAA